MAEETCIVCLGSLAFDSDVLSHTSNSKAAAAEALPHNNDDIAKPDAEAELIAFLLPCGHFLHDECLKPWVDRANSCPICRSAFNMVELRAAIGGPVISSYAVQDKRQEADVDPALVVQDDLFDDANQHEDPCLVCETYGDESELLLCDGCNNTTHVFCAGLDSVPSGAWFCYSCQQDPTIMTQTLLPTPRQRRRTRRAPREVGWERVWRSIFDRSQVDLDFPFEEEDPATDRQNEAERRELMEWRRRFDVARRQGAATRFRNTAHVLRNPPPPQPKPETAEETEAWREFEAARRREEGEPSPASSTRGRKRKSRSNTPREAATPPPTERKLKRPRLSTRRPQPSTEASGSNSVQSRPVTGTLLMPTPVSSRQQTDASGNPTFLQSLLSEVEAHPGQSITDSPDVFDEYGDAGSGVERSPSPQYSSPAASPEASNHPSPRAMTPPPHSPISRPVSPPPLASIISPIFPPAPGPDFSPFSPAVGDNGDRARGRQRQRPRQGSSSPNQSPSHSPTRPPISYEMKQEIQKMVSSALKPLYARKEVDKERYTEINRDVSRMLYEQVWDAGGICDQATRERWQKVAIEEVKRAVKASNDTKSSDTSRKPTPPPAPQGPVTAEVPVRPAPAVKV